MTAAWTDADVAALTAASCTAQHGMGAPARPCFACRVEAERVLGVVAAGIAARAKAEAWNLGFDNGWYAALDGDDSMVPNPYRTDLIGRVS